MERGELPSSLSVTDPFIEQVMLNLATAMAEGVPDLYAQTAGHQLAAHSLIRHAGLRTTRLVRDDARLARAEAYLRANLSNVVSPAVLARESGLSRFHLLRLFKAVYGETPFQRLNRLRMQVAKERLARGEQPVAEVARACDYDSPTHFALAFRRRIGVMRSAYRRRAR